MAKQYISTRRMVDIRHPSLKWEVLASRDGWRIHNIPSGRMTYLDVGCEGFERWQDMARLYNRGLQHFRYACQYRMGEAERRGAVTD